MFIHSFPFIGTGASSVASITTKQDIGGTGQDIHTAD